MESDSAADGIAALDRPRAPALEVVIVTYGGPVAVSNCLRSLQANVLPTIDTVVHVVDNSSPDETPDLIEAEFPWVRLHRRADNAGFAVANNQVLRTVVAPWILVLNPDTEVPSGVIEHLIRSSKAERRIGLLGCRLVQADGTFDHASKRSFPSPLDALDYFTPHRRSRSRYLAPHVDENAAGYVDAVNGAFMLVRREALLDVGLFDEQFWMYGEDLDWCKRFSDRGWSVLYDGRVTVTHLKGASSGKRRGPFLNWHFHRSMAIFYRKHQSGRYRLVDAFVYAGIGARLVVSMATNAMASWLGRGR
ncbi:MULTISPECIES: glycosyltransferase family 2 protein [unclassified Micromonospora]|uniref:glycosyltransferase family 2 protein n=1 Tax=unclassified Micromonospora TaxID=2617518 RepID=UPI002FF2692E